jgi:hypothetical protein
MPEYAEKCNEQSQGYEKASARDLIQYSAKLSLPVSSGPRGAMEQAELPPTPQARAKGYICNQDTSGCEYSDN